VFVLGLPYSNWTLAYKVDELFAVVAARYGLDLSKFDSDPFGLYCLIAESDLDGLRRCEEGQEGNKWGKLTPLMVACGLSGLAGIPG